jgi:hypothetical protein
MLSSNGTNVSFASDCDGIHLDPVANGGHGELVYKESTRTVAKSFSHDDDLIVG